MCNPQRPIMTSQSSGILDKCVCERRLYWFYWSVEVLEFRFLPILKSNIAIYMALYVSRNVLLSLSTRDVLFEAALWWLTTQYMNWEWNSIKVGFVAYKVISLMLTIHFPIMLIFIIRWNLQSRCTCKKIQFANLEISPKIDMFY